MTFVMYPARRNTTWSLMSGSLDCYGICILLTDIANKYSIYLFMYYFYY